MLVNITRTFAFGGRTYFAGENPDVDTQVGNKMIADGNATLDTGTQDWPTPSIASLVSRAGNPGHSVIAFGWDSLTQASSYAMGHLARGRVQFVGANINSGSAATPNINSAAVMLPTVQVDARCGTGTGTLTFTPGGAFGTLQWTAPGDTAGPVTAIPGDGFLQVESGSAGKPIYCAIRTKATDTLTAPATAKTDSLVLSGTPICSETVMDGFGAWATLLGAGKFGSAYNFGIAGDTPENALARIGQVIAVRPDVFVDLVGVNGLAAATLERWKTARRAIWDQLLAAGVTRILAGLVFPAGTLSTEGRRCVGALNRWVVEQAAASGGRIRMWDGYSVLVDVNNATAGEPLATLMKTDKLHLAPLGAYSVYKYALKPVLDDIAPPVMATHSSPADIYDATANPFGNLLTCGNFTGDSGAGDRSPATGTLGLGWTTGGPPSGVVLDFASPSSGSAVQRVGKQSKWQTFTYTGTGVTAGGAQEVYVKTSPVPGVGGCPPVGGMVRFSGSARLRNVSNILAVNIRLYFGGAGNSYAVQSLPAYTLDTLLGDTVEFDFCSDFIIPPGATMVRPGIQAVFGGGSSTLTVDVQDFDLRPL